MGLLTGRGLLDPRYFRHPTPSWEGDYVARVRLFDAHQDSDARPVWDAEAQEWTTGPSTDLWLGMGRISPNKDWRARNRMWADETTAEHAVRVQINLYKNLLLPREQWTVEHLVDIKNGTFLIVEKNPNDPIVEKYRFVVRNAIGASDNWHRTLLCDVDLGGRDG